MAKRSPIKSILEWTEHEPWHWTAMLNGERIDYWPTKKKWRYEGEIQTGDIVKFVKTQTKDGVLEYAKAFCEMDAEKQALCIEEIFKIATTWSNHPEAGDGQWWAIHEHLSAEAKAKIRWMLALILRKERPHSGAHQAS